MGFELNVKNTGNYRNLYGDEWLQCCVFTPTTFTTVKVHTKSVETQDTPKDTDGNVPAQ